MNKTKSCYFCGDEFQATGMWYHDKGYCDGHCLLDQRSADLNAAQNPNDPIAQAAADTPGRFFEREMAKLNKLL